MPLASGTRLGPYEILSPIGAGGMGEVYRGRDTRLDRTVAIKVLPEHLSRDPGRRERFEREARAVSSLNHPHICILHDIGSQETPQGPVDFLVMEFVEGQTLAERLAKGALPMEQVLRHSLEIADALDRAHRQGVVHRDLKPANIMLTKTGAKILDFGLAKLASAGFSSGAIGMSVGTVMPTATRELTAEGTILGTLHYMAPEQLEGKEADARTDLFAFGVVVYEMATARKAFEGGSQASLIAAIMGKDPPSIAALVPLTPPSLDRVVKRCLEKDPDERWQTARDLAHELRWIGQGGASAIGVPQQSGMAPATPGMGGAAGMASPDMAGVSSGSGMAYPSGAGQAILGPGTERQARWRTRLTPVAAALALVALGVLGFGMLGLGWRLRVPEPPRILRASMALPPHASLDPQNASLAFSPDSRVLAFSASEPDGKLKLWVRPLDSLQAQPLAGTEGATYPFWSPDGRFIGFFSDRKLRKVPASGGAVQALCDVVDGRGATWGRDGVIVFAAAPFGGLSQVPAAGGSPTPLTTTKEDGVTHRVPHFLPDGKRVLFLSSSGGDREEHGIYSVDLASKRVALVANENSEGLYAPPGYLIFVREGNLMAQPMDADTLRLQGEAAPIAEKVRFNPNRWTGAYAVSESGFLLYQGGGIVAKALMTWFGPDGKKVGTVGEPAPISEIRLSPDEKKAVVTLTGANSIPELWIYDLTRGLGSRFTFGPDPAVVPIWSPDGKQVVYTDGGGGLSFKAADGTSEPQTLVLEKSTLRQPTSWSPDGRTLVFRTQTGKTGLDLWTLPMQGDRTPKPFIATQANEQSGQFSPDGQWFGYLSDESGRYEVYVVKYPSAGGKWQISAGGANDFGWFGDGHRIAYVSDNKMVAVELSVQGTNLQVGAPQPLFGGQTLPDNLSITRDGRRFIGSVPIEEAVTPPLTLVTNWAEELARK